MKKMFRKSLSMLLSVIMVLSTVVIAFTGLTLTADAADIGSTRSSGSPLPDITFVVPEQIYLYQDGVSWKYDTHVPFQFFANNNSDGTKGATSSSGYVYVNIPNSDDIKLYCTPYSDAGLTNSLSGDSYWWVSTTCNGTKDRVGGTSAFNYTIPSGSLQTITINRDECMSVNMTSGTNYYYLLWKLTYTDKNDNLKKEAYAVSYVYKPYTVPVMAASGSGSGSSAGANIAAQVTWLAGFHEAKDTGTEFGSLDKKSTEYGRYSGSTAVAGVMSSESVAYSNSVKQTAGGWPGYGNKYVVFLNNGADSSTVARFYNSYGNNNIFDNCYNGYSYPIRNYTYGHYRGNVKNCTTWVHSRYTGSITVDTSRYTNLNQVPNLGVGLVNTSDQRSNDNSGAWYIADATGYSQFRSTWYDSESEANTYYNKYNYMISGQYGNYHDRDFGVNNEGIRYDGSWNRNISGTGTYTYTIKGFYGNKDGSYYTYSHSVIDMETKQIDKSSLRSEVATSTKKLGLFGVSGGINSMTSAYFGTNSNYKWSAFASAFRTAVITLANLKATQSEINSAYSALNSARNALKTSYVLHSSTHSHYSSQPSRAFATVGSAFPKSISNSVFTNPTFDTGYVLSGWSNNPNASTGSSPSTGIGYNEDLYAIARPKEFTVHFNGNGGTTSADIKVKYDSVPEKPALPTRTGYNFAGYYTSATGGSQVFDANRNYVVTSDHVWRTDGTDGGEFTYYAHWTPKTYTLSFVTNGGDSVANVTATYNASVPNATPSNKNGYVFGGYYSSNTNGNGSGTLCFNNSGVYQLGKWTTDGGQTFYAKWTAKSFTLHFNANGANATVAANKAVTFNSGVTAVAPGTRTGYKFDGYFDGDGTKIFDKDGAFVLGTWTRNGERANGSTVELYAHWTANDHTATFIDGDGSVLDTLPIKYDGVVTPTTKTPTKKSDRQYKYTFAAWQVGGTDYDFTTLVTGDVTLQPRFDRTAHEFTSEITTQPTCTVDGVRTFTCTGAGCNCGYTYDLPEPALGHDFVNKTEQILIHPTCTTGGTTREICGRANCDKGDGWYHDVPTHATNHDFSQHDWYTVPATCTEDGYREYRCTNYDLNENPPVRCTTCDPTSREVLRAKGHSWQEVDRNDLVHQMAHEQDCATPLTLYKYCPDCGKYADGKTLDENGNPVELTFPVGNPSDNHKGGFTYTNMGDGTHEAVCQYCGRVDATKTVCHGGTATCRDAAVCVDCLASYGLVSETHEGGYAYRQVSNTQHEKYCEYCNRAVETPENCNDGQDGATANCTTRAVCEKCNRAYGTVNPDNHDFTVDYTPTGIANEKCSDATCRDKATYFLKCSRCGTLSTDENDTFSYGDYAEHRTADLRYTKENATDNRHLVSCSYCNNAHAAPYYEDCDDTVGGTTWTCTTQAVCAKCGTGYGDTRPHTYSFEKVWAAAKAHDNTCTRGTEYYYTCSECETAVEHNSAHTFFGTDIGGHSFTEWTPATPGDKEGCENSCDYIRSCDKCHGSEMLYEEGHMTVKATKHTFAAYTPDLSDSTSFKEKTPANCTDKAVYLTRCTECGRYYDEVDANYIKDGSKADFEWGELIDDAHDYVAGEVHPAKCEEQGWTDYTCSRDPNHTKKDDFTDPAGHRLVDYIVAPKSNSVMRAPANGKLVLAGSLDEKATCTHKATYYKYCPDCGKYANEIAPDKLPTGVEITFEYGNPNGHTFEDNWFDIKDAKCTEQGEQERICTTCNGAEKDGGEVQFRPTDALGHIGGTATCVDKAVCDRCGDSYGTVDPNNHIHTELVRQTDATCTKHGYTGDVVCLDEKDADGNYLVIKKGTETELAPHTDNDNDHKCDNCGTDDVPTTPKNCSCICHQIWNSKFAKIIYKISLVFWKLFRIKRVCACGEWHYLT